MSIKYPNISKSKAQRFLEYSKASIPKTLNRAPLKSEGSNGDMIIGNIAGGIKLYIKIIGRWYAFSPDKDSSQASNIVNYKADSDGIAASPSRNLLVEESGTTFIIDISSNTAVFKLPSIDFANGVEYTFIMAVESNDEDTKDFVVLSNNTQTSPGSSGISEQDIQGIIQSAGTTTEITTNTSTVQFNSSTSSAPITTGDFIKFICDGRNWYVHGITKFNHLAINNGHVIA
mgnify:CR=1 FL=1